MSFDFVNDFRMVALEYEILEIKLDTSCFLSLFHMVM